MLLLRVSVCYMIEVQHSHCRSAQFRVCGMVLSCALIGVCRVFSFSGNQSDYALLQCKEQMRAICLMPLIDTLLLYLWYVWASVSHTPTFLTMYCCIYGSNIYNGWCVGSSWSSRYWIQVEIQTTLAGLASADPDLSSTGGWGSDSDSDSVRDYRDSRRWDDDRRASDRRQWNLTRIFWWNIQKHFILFRHLSVQMFHSPFPSDLSSCFISSGLWCFTCVSFTNSLSNTQSWASSWRIIRWSPNGT